MMGRQTWLVLGNYGRLLHRHDNHGQHIAYRELGTIVVMLIGCSDRFKVMVSNEFRHFVINRRHLAVSAAVHAEDHFPGRDGA